MAYYLVRATPKRERLAELQQQLRSDAFVSRRPFGKALRYSLHTCKAHNGHQAPCAPARRGADGGAIWEEEDYCSPPLAQERAAVLDLYFDAITVEKVDTGEGWARIERLPKLNTEI